MEDRELLEKLRILLCWTVQEEWTLPMEEQERSRGLLLLVVAVAVVYMSLNGLLGRTERTYAIAWEKDGRG